MTKFLHTLVLTVLMTTGLSVNSMYGQNSKRINEINKLIDSDATRLKNIFKDIHTNPELGFMETRTSAIVAKELKALGYKVITGIGKTGVVGIMENGKGPTVMYRADMDANSVKETTGLPYASTKTVLDKDGKEMPAMHACGHDAHTTWLLGIAKVVATMKNQWKGTVVFVAQPAEEIIMGAKAMVEDGMYSKGVPEPDYLFGMHTMPFMLGSVVCEGGTRMAGTDQLDVTFYGIGGHGSSPHLTKDPVIMATNAVSLYQNIISRAIDPQHAAVLTVGAIHAGTDNNVIPSSALLKVNLRWFKDTDRNIMLENIDRINKSIASTNNLPEKMYPTTIMKGHSTPLINDEKMITRITTALKDLLPEEKFFKEFPVLMGSEDFHHLIIEDRKIPYAYINVGIVNPETYKKAKNEGKQFPFFPHNSDYLVDIDAIPLGTKIGAVALLDLLGS